MAPALPVFAGKPAPTSDRAVAPQAIAKLPHRYRVALKPALDLWERACPRRS
ncbi:hypothetical protein PRJ_5261 [Pseudomonas sp. XWY-1]|nr:hypothetical protein PRJ_5261 [Pseudomonas sp. XWY-1]